MANPWEQDEIVETASAPWEQDEVVEQRTGATSSSSAPTMDAGYDNSKLRSSEKRTSDIPQKFTPPEEDEIVPEHRNLPIGPIDSFMDWMQGTSKAAQANPGIAGQFAKHVYNESMIRNMTDEQAQGLGYESAKDYVYSNQETFKQELLKDVSKSQEIAGSILAGVADPVALASGSFGLSTAHGLARTLKLATAGGAYSGVYETLDQLVEEGEITDPMRIAAFTAVGTAIPPGLDKGFRVAKKIVDESTLRSLERHTKANIDEGMNQRAAFNLALSRMGLDKDTVGEIIDGNGLTELYADTLQRWTLGKTANKAALRTKDYVDFSKVNNGILQNIKNKTVGAITSVRDGVDSLIQPISSGIRKISPEVFGAIRRFEYNTHKDTNAWRAVVEPAQNVYQKFSYVDKTIFKKAVRNRDMEVAEALYRKHGGADGVQAFRSVRGVLDDAYTKLKNTGVDVNYLTNHWPMYVKKGEYDRLAAHMGWDPKSTWEKATRQKAIAKGLKADIQNEIARLEKKYGRELLKEEIDHVKADVKLWERRKINLTDKEKADILNSQLKGIDPRGLKTPTASKGRVIEKVSDDMLEYIEDPFVNLMSYIDHAAHTINTRKFFGKHVTDGDPNTGTDDSIGAFVGELLERGDIRAKDYEKLRKLLNARFTYAETDPITARVKNVFYATQLGQADSALTQLGDLGTAAYVNGLRNTLHGLFRPKVDNALEAVQVRKIAQEFDNTRSTAKALNSALSWSGFRSIDALGKKALIEGSLRKNMGLVKKAKGIESFRAKWEPVFQGETDDLIGALQRGEVNDNVKFMLFNELSDVQPISLLEVPATYLKSPGGRVFYAMKTFMMKQIDLARRTQLDKIMSGNVRETAEGMGNMLKYTMTVAPVNMTTEQMKNWLSGREVDFTDYQWTTLMKNFGISNYLVRKMSEATDQDKSPTTPFIEYLLSNPYTGTGEVVYRAGNDVWVNLVKGGTQFESLQDLPPVGQVIYNLWGGGAEKIMEQERKKFMTNEYESMYEDEYADYK